MKELAVLFIFILGLGSAALGIDFSAEGGPHLVIASFSGNLEIGRTEPLSFELRNNVATKLSEELPIGLENKSSEARGIVAELKSRDSRIKILSGPQLAGSLAPGENRSVVFLGRAEESAGVGIYPLDLVLTYSMQSKVEVTGDPGLPDITFEYENAAQVIPIDAKAILGPKISIEDVKGKAAPGKESEIEIAFANHGDRPAMGLQSKIYPQSPFESVTSTEKLGDLESQKSTPAKLRVTTRNGTTQGYYALPCSVSYMDGNAIRTDELAALVEVKEQSWIMSLQVLIVAMLIIEAGIYLGAKWLRGRKRRLRKW